MDKVTKVPTSSSVRLAGFIRKLSGQQNNPDNPVNPVQIKETNKPMDAPKALPQGCL